MSRHSRGFTLAELLLVLTILTILAGISAPRFRDLRARWEFEESVRLMMTDLRRAHAEAIRTGGEVELVFLGSFPERYEVKLARPVQSVPIDEWAPRDAYPLDAAATLRTRELPAGVRCRPPLDRVFFAPDGTCSGGKIHVISDGQDRGFTLSLDPVLGRVSVEEVGSAAAADFTSVAG